MKPAIRIIRQTCTLLAVALAVTGLKAAPVARFWLEDTITRKTYGPVLNQAGYQFQIETERFVVLNAQKGQVLFSTWPATQYLGPFDLQPERIIDLGTKAYAIVQLDTVDAPKIPHDVLPAPKLPPTPPTQEQALVQIPVEPPAPALPEAYPALTLWFEPFHRTKYDWTLGEHEGKRASDLEYARIGLSLNWGGFGASAGLSFEGEHAKSVMPATNTVITGLKLEDGSGFYAAVGYMHRIPLDRSWNAFLGGLFEYRDESYDLTATVYDGVETIIVEIPQEGDLPSLENGDDEESPSVIEEEIILYRDLAKSVDLREMALSLRGGISYESDAWGTSMELLLCVWDDTKMDGIVDVMGEELKLKGSRSHPVSVSAAAWCYIFEGIWTEARVTLGAETAVRAGVGYEW